MGAVLDFFNHMAHVPVLEDWIFYGFWFWAYFAGPWLALFIFFFDLFTGYFVPLWTVEPGPDKAVFITGCDTGFGRALAVRLGQKGFKVYAACLTDKGMEDLKKECDILIPVKVDVTKEADVQAAYERIASENPHGLWALVNNAGVSRAGLVDWLSMKDFRFCMEVNFFAVVSVTKTFLPLIKRSRGRIINMSSAAGVACGYPITCAYSASKHAVELFTSSLRQEMKPWGIKVITLNPGFHRTEINHSAAGTLQGVWERLPKELQDQYGEDYVNATEEKLREFTVKYALDPENVIKAYEHAVMSTRPRLQYRVGIDAKYMFPWLQLLPLRIGEMFAYSASTNQGMRKIVGLRPSPAPVEETKTEP